MQHLDHRRVNRPDRPSQRRSAGPGHPQADDHVTRSWGQLVGSKAMRKSMVQLLRPPRLPALGDWML